MKLANHYLLSEFVMDMLANLCPHCEGEGELDADASGEFECPHCRRNFEWKMKHEDPTIAKPGSGKVAPRYARLLNKAILAVPSVPLIWAFVLLPISLLAGLVMIFLSANFFIAGSGLSSWMVEELTKFDFSDQIEIFWGIMFVITILAIALLVFLIAVLFGLSGLGIIFCAGVMLIRR